VEGYIAARRILVFKPGGVSDSDSVTDMLGHYGDHPHPQVANRGTQMG